MKFLSAVYMYFSLINLILLINCSYNIIKDKACWFLYIKGICCRSTVSYAFDLRTGLVLLVTSSLVSGFAASTAVTRAIDLPCAPLHFSPVHGPAPPRSPCRWGLTVRLWGFALVAPVTRMLHRGLIFKK